MKTRRIILILLGCIGSLAIHGTGEASGKAERTYRYDRIELLERFLKVLYPDLARKLAMFNIGATFEADRGVIVRNLRFFPCRFVTSVGVPTMGGIIPIGPQQATPPPSPPKPLAEPVCGEDPTPEFEHFLDVSVGFTPGNLKHPFFRFHASGTYVDSKLQQVREQFAGEPHPTDDEASRVLRSKSPKYGPDNRKAFLQALPLEEIHRLTGCSLQPESAMFVVELEENPQHLPPDLQWHLAGSAAAADRLTATTCNAVFEPFDGHLTLFLD